MKKPCYLLVLGVYLLVSATNPISAQKLWGTLPNAFYTISPDGTGYEERFKNFDFGTEAAEGLFVGPDGTVYGSTRNARTNSIFKYRPGDFLPTPLYLSESSSYVLQIADFNSGYFYGRRGNSLFKAKVDGTELTILKSASNGDSFDVQFLHDNYLYGISNAPTPHLSYFFRIAVDGTNYEILRTFNTWEEQITSFILNDNYEPPTEVWAISPAGGRYGLGAVYSISLDGSTLSTIVHFKGTPKTDGDVEGEFNYDELHGDSPVAILKDTDTDVYVITERGGARSNAGGIYMIGQDGLDDLHSFTIEERSPGSRYVIDDEGTIYGYTGLYGEDSGFLFSFNPREGFGYEILEDFTASQKVGWPHSIALANTGKIFGVSRMANRNLQQGTLFSIDRDGSDLERIFYFEGPAYNPTWIVNEQKTVFGVFTNVFQAMRHGGVGSLFRYSENASLQHLHRLPEATARSIKLTAGHDGHIYGLNAEHDYLFKAEVDGPAFVTTAIPGLDSHTPLSQTSLGLFGTTFNGGSSDKGFIFRVKSDFSGIDIVRSFSAGIGVDPHGQLIEVPFKAGHSSVQYLYGTTRAGGAGFGVIFRFNPLTRSYHKVYSFAGGKNGAYPLGGLVSDAKGRLYGTTSSGGKYNDGVLFRINSNGTGYKKLFDFNGRYGKSPFGELIIDNKGNLFGLTSAGGTHNRGVLYRYSTKRGFVKMKDFVSTPVANLALADPGPARTHVIEPTDGMTEVSIRPVLHFMPVEDAKKYTVEISKSPDFKGKVITETGSYPRARPDVVLNYNTTYYTRVRTDIGPGYGKVVSFRTHGAEKHAFITSPEDGEADVDTDDLRVTANHVYGAWRYTIELNTSADFSGRPIVKASISRNQRTFTFDRLSPGTVYYARVKTNLSHNWGPVRSFTTRLIDDGDGVLCVFPNPFRHHVTIAIRSADEGKGRLVLYDLAGRELKNIPVWGNVTFTLGQELKPGIYILRYFERHRVITRRVVKK